MRITGGKFKNRKLFVPTGRNVRPTSDRMRQTLFNLLHHAKWRSDFNIEGAIVMDVFCGSGALGVEALSHGAKYCVFVDLDVTAVNQNTSFIDDNHYRILKKDASRLSEGEGDVSLVFIDPPYRKDLVEPTVTNLIDKNWLADQAIIVIEAEKSLILDLPLEHLDTRTQSQSNLHIFRYNAAIKQNQQNTA